MNVHDTILIDFEWDFDLRNTSRGRRNTIQVELSEQVVILGHLSFSFEHLNQHTRLIVSVGCESLGFLGWDGCVSRNQNSHHTSGCLNTQWQWGDVNKQKRISSFRSLSAENSSLDSSTVGNSLIGVDGSVGFLSVEEFLEEINNLGNSSWSSDQDNFVDLILGHLRISQNFFNWGNGFLEHGHAEFFEFGSSDGQGEILGFGKRVNLDGSLSGWRQDSLGFLALSSQSSHSSGIWSDINAFLLEEVSSAMLDKLVIKVLTSQVGITSGSFDFEHSFVDGKERNIESSSSQIEDKNVLFTMALLVKTISDSSSSRFVDDPENIQTSNWSSILCGLPLVIVEISGDSDDCIFAVLAEERFSGLSHFGQDHWRNFFRMEFLGLSFVFDNNNWLLIRSWFNLEWPKLGIFLDDGIIELPSDKSLCIEDGVSRVLGGLIFGGISNESFSISEGNVGWSGSVALIVGDDFDSFILPDTDTWVGGTEIDTDCLPDNFFISHGEFLFVFFLWKVWINVDTKRIFQIILEKIALVSNFYQFFIK